MPNITVVPSGHRNKNIQNTKAAEHCITHAYSNDVTNLSGNFFPILNFRNIYNNTTLAKCNVAGLFWSTEAMLTGCYHVTHMSLVVLERKKESNRKTLK